MAEMSMDRLRRRVVYECSKIDPNVPPEPKREGGDRLLEAIRPLVLKLDASTTDVSVYEAIVAADEFRLFVDSAVRTITERAREAHARGVI